MPGWPRLTGCGPESHEDGDVPSSLFFGHEGGKTYMELKVARDWQTDT